MTMFTRRFAGLATALVMVAAPALAQDLSGTYAAQGRNPDGSAYQGSVVLTHSANVVSMAWRVGNSSYIGTGVQEGRVVTVDWGQGAPVVYVVMPDGALHGTWADGFALERLTRD